MDKGDSGTNTKNNGYFGYRLIFGILILWVASFTANASVTLEDRVYFSPQLNADVYALAKVGDFGNNQDIDTLIAGGLFTTAYLLTPRNYIVQYLDDDVLDIGFDGPILKTVGIEALVLAIAWQPNGKILVSGKGLTYLKNNVRTLLPRVFRLNADGSLDSSFKIRSGDDFVYAISLLPDGKILIGGDFKKINNNNYYGIARLNPTGSVDTSFTPPTNLGRIRSIVQQPDGKILLGGLWPDGVVRLNAYGTRDSSFTPPADSNGGVYAIALQADGKVLLGGTFTSFGGEARKRMARLNSNGSFDYGFGRKFSNRGMDATILSISPQENGKILIAGAFTTVDNFTQKGIARLNANGLRDTSFDLTTQPNNTVNAITRNKFGTAIIGGKFTSFSNSGTVPTSYLAKINLGELASNELTVSADGSSLDFVYGNAAPVLQWVRVEMSDTGTGNWQYLGIAQRSGTAWRLSGLDIPFEQTKFIRLRGYFASGQNNGSGSIVALTHEIYLPKPVNDSICFPVNASNGRNAIICL